MVESTSRSCTKSGLSQVDPEERDPEEWHPEVRDPEVWDPEVRDLERDPRNESRVRISQTGISLGPQARLRRCCIDLGTDPLDRVRIPLTPQIQLSR